MYNIAAAMVVAWVVLDDEDAADAVDVVDAVDVADVVDVADDQDEAGMPHDTFAYVVVLVVELPYATASAHQKLELSDVDARNYKDQLRMAYQLLKSKKKKKNYNLK